MIRILLTTVAVAAGFVVHPDTATGQSLPSVTRSVIRPTPLGCGGHNERYVVPGSAAGKANDRFVWPIGKCQPISPPPVPPIPPAPVPGKK